MKFSILFYPDRERDLPDGRLRCRIRFNGEVMSLNLGYRVEHDKWNADTRRCKRNTVTNGHTAQEINHAIDVLELRIIDILCNRTSIDKNTLRNLINSDSYPSRRHVITAIDLLNDYIRISRISLAPRTIKSYITLRNHISNLSPNVTVAEMDNHWLREFVLSLAESASSRRSDGEVNNTTLLAYVKKLKTFLSWCKSEGLYSLDPHDLIVKLPTTSQPVFYLEWDELMTVFNAPLSKLSLAESRDVFCFCCFTGLRYSDVRNLRSGSLSTGTITLTTIKTHTSLTIPLNKYALEIAQRYQNYDSRHKALPTKPIEDYNDDIKAIFRELGFCKPITVVTYHGTKRIETTLPQFEVMSSHSARRTFVCNALALGIAPHTVMAFTGHSSYAAMQPYIRATDASIQSALDKFNKN